VIRAPDRSTATLFVCGVLANLLPFAVWPRSLPDLQGRPFDNVWITQYTADIVSGAPLSVAPDPWFRYVPQVLLLEVVSWVRAVTVRDALVANAAYTVVCEAIVGPVLLAGLVGVLYIRRAAVATLFVTAGFRLLTLAVAPYLDSEARGLLWYYTDHWQYAFTLPWLLVTLLAVAYAATHRPDPVGSVAGRTVTTRHLALVTAGLSLGLTASVQFVHGGVAAYVLAVAYVRTRRLGDLLTVALTSMVAFLPNLLIYRRYPDRWLRQGIEKSAPGEAQLGVGIVGLLLVGLFAVLVGLYAGGARRRHRLLECWAVVTGGLFAVLYAVGARWYTHHLLYLFTYSALALVGVAVATLLEERFFEKRGREELAEYD
jgi:hypothetical protein